MVFSTHSPTTRYSEGTAKYLGYRSCHLRMTISEPATHQGYVLGVVYGRRSIIKTGTAGEEREDG